MNGTVIGGVAFIGGVAIVRSISDHKPITPVIAGSFIFLAFMGGIELLGGETEKIADALVLLAVIVVVLDVLPWQDINKILAFRIGKQS